MLLPTFRRPTIAIFISGGARSSAASISVWSGRLATIPRQQILFAAIVLGTDQQRLAQPKLSELAADNSKFSPSHLLATSNTGLSVARNRWATCSSSGVEPVWASTTNMIRSAVAKAEFDLLFDFDIQIIDVVDADSAGIHNFEISVVVLHQDSHAVAGDAGHVINNRQSLSGQPIENTGFAHVGSAHNGNFANRHGNAKNSAGLTGCGGTVR